MGILDSLFGKASGAKVDYNEKIKNGAIIVDVRTAAEFNSGHAKGSKNIPLQSLSTKINQLKGKEIILVCRSGARAGQAKSVLGNNGIIAYNAGAWQNLN